jgi:hypothetical protein
MLRDSEATYPDGGIKIFPINKSVLPIKTIGNLSYDTHTHKVVKFF